MKILITGVSGQLGHDVSIQLKKDGHTIFAPDHSEMDICNTEMIIDYFKKNNPDVVIHCAAWTAVDSAEDEKEACMAVNVQGTKNLVEQCRKNNIAMMYFSTDYVFNGSGNRPWTVDDKTDPINVYGLSKRDGESAVRSLEKYFIVRISWVFGINGKNFVKTMIRLGSSNSHVRVVCDQYGSPTYTVDLAALVSKMIITERYGIYHAHNEGMCSWYEFAKKIFELNGQDVDVEPISSEQFPMKAKRPMNGYLDTSALVDAGFELLPPWEDALLRYLDELKRTD